MDSLSFVHKIMVRDDGHMVTISRVLLPEYANAREINFRPNLDKDGLGISSHTFETDDNVQVTSIVFTYAQYVDPKG